MLSHVRLKLSIVTEKPVFAFSAAFWNLSLKKVPTVENVFFMPSHVFLKKFPIVLNPAFVFSAALWNLSLKKFPTAEKIFFIFSHIPLKNPLTDSHISLIPVHAF